MTDRRWQIDWDSTRDVFRRGFRSSLHCAMASVGPDGAPHVTPIGSVLLTEPGRGIFFDMFTSDLSYNLDNDPQVCVMAVDSGRRFWLTALTRGRFSKAPAVRLSGTAGPRREATPQEQARFLRRVRPASRLRGHQLLWSNLAMVRDLEFEDAEPVNLGAMTQQV